MGAAESTATAFIGFAAVAALTWFFSSRPRLFIRLLVPREELFGAGRHILRRDEFRHSLRLMARLQFAAACVFGFVALWLGI